MFQKEKKKRERKSNKQTKKTCSLWLLRVTGNRFLNWLNNSKTFERCIYCYIQLKPCTAGSQSNLVVIEEHSQATCMSYCKYTWFMKEDSHPKHSSKSTKNIFQWFRLTRRHVEKPQTVCSYCKPFRSGWILTIVKKKVGKTPFQRFERLIFNYH